MGVELRCDSAVGILITCGEYEKYAKILNVKSKASKIIEKLYKVIENLDLSETLEIELFEGIGILIYFDGWLNSVESWPGVIDFSSYAVDVVFINMIEDFKGKASGSVLSLKFNGDYKSIIDKHIKK